MALKVHNSCLLIIAVISFFPIFVLQKGVQKAPTWYRVMQGQQKDEYYASQKPYDCHDTVRFHFT